jgi:3-hydroxyisobutyrate dehydrogenase
MTLQVSPEKTQIGWIGTGVMGGPMCGHLIAAGYQATVTTRTKSKAAPLLELGARWADSPREVAAQSDVVFSIVGYPADVREVLLGDDGALAGCKPGDVLVDLTTSEPALAVEIAAAAAKKNVASVDAPVSGGDVGARNGTLSIMIGGDAATVTALEPIWKLLGSKWVYQGGPGAGQHTKVVNQTLIASGMIGVCEALLYAYRAGLDLETVLESVAGGAAGSWSLTNYGPRIIAGNFAPGFYVEHMIKDLLPGVELAEALYQKLAAQGHARDGTHALVLALAQMSGVEWPASTKS